MTAALESPQNVTPNRRPGGFVGLGALTVVAARVFGMVIAVAGLTLGFTITAFAQEPPAAQGETRYSFDDDLVSGDLVRPDGEQLVVRRRGKRATLIQIREHFIPEMLKSVEDL